MTVATVSHSIAGCRDRVLDTSQPLITSTTGQSLPRHQEMLTTTDEPLAVVVRALARVTNVTELDAGKTDCNALTTVRARRIATASAFVDATSLA